MTAETKRKKEDEEEGREIEEGNVEGEVGGVEAGEIVIEERFLPNVSETNM